MTALLDVVFRSTGLAFGLVLVLVIALRGGWRQRADLLAVVGCAAAYLVCATPSQPCCASPAFLPLLLGAMGFPFAFWRLARIVLEDDAKVPVVAWTGLAVLLASGLLAAADYLGLPDSSRIGFGIVNKLAAFAFVGAALLTAWRSWDGDLLEPRRRLRWLLVGYLGIYGLVVLVSEVYWVSQRAPAWLEAVNAAMISLTLLGVLLFLLGPRAPAMDMLFAPAPVAPTETRPSDANGALLQRLRTLMEQDKLYRDPDLTVGGLASRLAVPEYLVRRLIHDSLGYRNFAAFINEYRLGEVSHRLADPALDRRPILTLALEAGFGSIGPFNRAFRERHGITPTEFRTRKT